MKFGWMLSVLLLSYTAAGRVELSWTEPFALPSLPGSSRPNPGVARPFAGESNGQVLLAGGANFPDRPLAEGGAKRYHDEIWGFGVTEAQPVWRFVGRLPVPWGEGAYATTPTGIVCVAGAVGAPGGTVTNGCFLMTWDASAQKVRFASLPPFPEAVKYPAAAARGTTVYAVGRTCAAKIDVAAPSPVWTRLPDLPMELFQPACAVVNLPHQQTGFLVFADRTENGVRRTGGWSLSLSGEKSAWTPLPDVAEKEVPATSDRMMTGALAVTSGDQHVLIFGGTSRAVYNQYQATNACARTPAARAAARHWYLTRPAEWFRFGRKPLAYHAVTARWFTLAEQPFPGGAGSAVLKLSDGRILVAGGEVGPGVRTPQAHLGTFVKTKGFHMLDLAIILVYLLGMGLLGVWFMYRNKSSDDYFRGGGRLPWWVVSLSIYATMFSSITFLSVPAMSYLSDCRYFAISFGIILLAPVVVKWYLPFFRKLNLTSAYEYLEVRFNLPCRLFASAAFILFMVARTAVVTYLPALAIAAVTEIDINWAILAVTAVTIFYCTLGGVEAVIWSDFIQSVILIGSTALIFILLVAGTDGGFAGFCTLGAAAEKFRVFDFTLDWSKPVFWVVLIGGLVANLASYTSDQCVVQRYMTTKDEAGAAKSILFNGVISFLNCLVFFALGVALWTFYASNPQKLDVTMPKNDSVFSLFIGNDLPLGVSGLILAALAAATMSTLSANLNSAASAIVTDFWARLRRADDRSKLLCGKVSTVVTGVLGGGFALVLANMEIYSVYDQFQRFLGVLTGGLGCLFLMGIFMKRVNGAGAVAGLAANYAVCFTLDQIIWAGKPHLLLYGFLGMLACLIVAPVVSALTRRRA